MFLAYTGRMRWRTRAGDEVAAVLGADQAKDVTQQAWRTALDPQGEWIPQVLRAADRRLTEVRKHVPDAGGLVIATDQTKARAYAKQLAGDHRAQARPSCSPTTRRPASKITAFSDEQRALDGRGAHGERGRRRAAAHGRASTPPRPRRRCSSPRPSAASCAPGAAARPRACSCRACRCCCGCAGELEEERDHVLGRRARRRPGPRRTRSCAQAARAARHRRPASTTTS